MVCEAVAEDETRLLGEKLLEVREACAPPLCVTLLSFCGRESVVP